MKTTKLTFIVTLLAMILLSTNAFAEKKVKETVKQRSYLHPMAEVPSRHMKAWGNFRRQHNNKDTVKQEWYLRLIAEVPSQYMKDRGNVLGHLNDSVNGYDSHDLPEMAPFGDNYLTIVFPHPEWGEKADDYTSDYHNPNAYNADEWTFEVGSSANSSDVKLYWEGLNVLSTSYDGNKLKRKEKRVIKTLLQRMWLEDTATGERIEAVVNNKLQSYTFNMNGSNVRVFRWGIDEYTKKRKRTKKEKRTKRTKKLKDDKMAVKLLVPEQVSHGKLGKPGQPK